MLNINGYPLSGDESILKLPHFPEMSGCFRVIFSIVCKLSFYDLIMQVVLNKKLNSNMIVSQFILKK